MSGGLYGRGKAPERCCLKLEAWPTDDQLLWRAALTPADPFEPEGGARARHAAISNRKAEKGYGRWLTWLRREEVDLPTAAAPLITPERVAAYVESMSGVGNGCQTILARLQELGEVAVVLAPDRDWTFIKTIASRVRALGGPKRDKRSKLVTSDELLGLGLALMEEAERASAARQAAILYRDGLLVALLALRPLRRRNLAALSLGDTLQLVGQEWWIVIDGSRTKTGDPIEAPWPAALAGALATYLEQHRPALVSLTGRWSAPASEALWISSDGSPMTEIAIYDRIRQRTLKAFGRAINPHLFRDAAATTLAIADPAHVRMASTLLSHRSSLTTERHYQQAQSLSAHRLYAETVLSEDQT